MSEWSCIAGGTVLIPTGNESHLFVILNDPTDFDGHIPKSCLLVNISTVKPDIPYDKTCVLSGGCHPFIQHDSYVAYRYIRLDPASHYEKHVEAGTFIAKEPLDDGLLKIIQQGLKVSPHTPGYAKKLI